MRRLVVVLVIALAVWSRWALAHGDQGADRARPLPDGPARPLVERACAGCHTFFLSPSTRQSAERWTGVVDDMITRGAEVSPTEYEAILGYLTEHFGPVDVNSAPATELVAAGLTVAEADGIVATRKALGRFATLKDLAKVSALTAIRLKILEPKLTVGEMPITKETR